MLQKNTLVYMIDNSGVQKVKCVHKYKKRCLLNNSNIGSVFLSSIKKQKQKKDLLKSKLNSIMISHTKKKTIRKNGEFFKAYKNKAIFIDDKNNLISTRIKNKIPKELNIFTNIKKKSKKLF